MCIPRANIVKNCNKCKSSVKTSCPYRKRAGRMRYRSK